MQEQCAGTLIHLHKKNMCTTGPLDLQLLMTRTNS